MPKKLTSEEFINKAKAIRTDINFDYSKVVYVNTKTKVIIIDPEFGEFKISPDSFLRGHSNYQRGELKRINSKIGYRKYNTETFIQKAKEVRTDINFDYSKTIYIGARDKLTIIDPEFGEFKITADNFLRGRGHKKRRIAKHVNLYSSSTEEFIRKAKKIRTDINFDYSKVDYINAHINVIIIDPEFGEFTITPNNFFNGRGHPKRSGHHHKYGYIQLIMDGEIPVGIKYGIETTNGSRTSRQNKKSTYMVIRIKTFEFDSTELCKAAETECKSIFQKENRKLYKRNGLLTKKEFPDGYTETTSISNTDKIIEIYKKFNGKEIDRVCKF